MPGAGSLPQRVLRLAEASSLGADAARRRAPGQDPVDLGRQPGDLWLPSDPSGTASGGRAGEPEARGTPDEGFGHSGRDAEALQDGDDQERRESPACAGPGEPQLLGRRSRPAVGRRHHPGPTWAGWLYLAVVLDAWSRRIVGWAMAPHMRAELVEGALAMAISNRKPKGRVVHHSDQGSQYTSLAFGKRCREAGVVQSMGSVGDAYDNAMCESFFATLECELLDRSRFPTPADARREVFGFIEGFYNTRRIHSALGYKSPTNFERLNHAA